MVRAVYVGGHEVGLSNGVTFLAPIAVARARVFRRTVVVVLFPPLGGDLPWGRPFLLNNVFGYDPRGRQRWRCLSAF